MFDALLKSKFYSKCKSDVKLTKTRIDIIKRKRKAMEKYLRKDIADLLKNGLDSNAYGRAEGLYVEQNLSSCYEFVEQSCLFISNHLSAMNKQSECPAECREAIASLMFAAARFADLPELRDLRSLFSERYGNCLEIFVNKEFVMKLKAEPPTKDMKFQLMQEIALESGIEWNLKALEQKLYKPPPSTQDWSQNANKHRIIKSQKNRHLNALKTDIKETEHKNSSNATEVMKEKDDILHEHPFSYKSSSEVEKDGDNIHGRKLSYRSRNINSLPSEITTSPENNTSLKDDVSDDLVKGKKFFGFRSMAPPYIKTDNTKKGTISNTSPSSAIEEQKDNFNDHQHQEESSNKTSPVPRSVRRRPSKPSPVSNENKEISKFPNGEIRNNDHRDEEERTMDKLLLHYSRKPSPLPDLSSVKSLDMKNINYREGGAPTRVSSLPPESLPSPARKGHARAASYQLDSSLSPSGHVHPKLPDYDDFVARLAAFKANC